MAKPAVFAASAQEKKPEPAKPKDSLWDDAKDMLDMDNLMKTDPNQPGIKKVSGGSDLYNALYGRPAGATNHKGIY